jgi:hypothetical protein
MKKKMKITVCRENLDICLSASAVTHVTMQKLMKAVFSVYLTLPAALGPGVYSASNRHEYHKQKNNAFLE